MTNGSEFELLKLRFDYAWKHFEYHARQRITMFSYFLIIVGILGNAYGIFLKEGLCSLASGSAILGAIISIGFLCLDIRNRQLVQMGEQILKKLEEESIFTSAFRANGSQLGFLFREDVEERLLRKWSFAWLRRESVTHKVWIRLIESVIAAAFIGAAIVPRCA